ncbi:MAG TPA: GlsB/YeaQ/YmgE family stress response membrane protein [Anaeromyxobacter sp.]
MGIIAWIVFGFIVGLIARAIVPGRQGMGFVMTTLLGIAGSLIGGLIASALWGHGAATRFEPTGLIGSIIGAIILLVIGGMVMGPRRRTV